MGENIINSRTISTKLNRIFSWLVMYQGMMTFVLMLKERGMGLLANTKGSRFPRCRGRPCLRLQVWNLQPRTHCSGFFPQFRLF